MRVDGLDYLVIVVADALELVVKVVQPGHELRLRGVAPHDNELLAEDAADDKAAAVLLRSGLGKHPPETEVLFFVQAEGVLVAPRRGFISFSHYHHQSKVARLGSAATAPQGERFCRTNGSLSDKNTARYRRATVWIGYKTIPRKSSKSAFRNQGVSPRRWLPLRGDAAELCGSCTVVRAGCAPGAILRRFREEQKPAERP